jgi:hypothetical protein
MTTVYGSIKRGKGEERLALEVSSEMSREQWETFKEELKALVKKHGSKVTLNDLQIKRNK